MGTFAICPKPPLSLHARSLPSQDHSRLPLSLPDSGPPSPLSGRPSSLLGGGAPGGGGALRAPLSAHHQPGVIPSTPGRLLPPGPPLLSPLLCSLQSRVPHRAALTVSTSPAHTGSHLHRPCCPEVPHRSTWRRTRAVLPMASRTNLPHPQVSGLSVTSPN